MRSAPQPEVGWFEIEVAAGLDPLLSGFPKSFTTFSSHQEEIVEGLPGLSVTARSKNCAVQAFRVADRPLWGVQFHSEMGAEETRGIVERRARKQADYDAQAVLRSACDSSALMDRLLTNFVAQMSQS